MPAWVLWSLLSNAAIMGVEYANRYYSPESFLATLKFTWPLILAAQFGLFKAWSGAPHFLAAWLVFTVGNSCMRIALVKFGTEEPFAWWGTAGIGLILAGAFVVKEAMRYGASG